MRGGESTGTKADLEGLPIADDDDQSDLAGHCEVCYVVSETLLRQRQGSRFANNEVDHLETDNRDQERTLSVLVGFNCIANLFVGHIRNTPEPWD